MINFDITNNRLAKFIGPLYLLGSIFWPSDPEPAAKQIEKRYAHGGGFMPFEGFSLKNWKIPGKAKLLYFVEDVPADEQDPPVRELARSTLRDETLILFEQSLLAIVQPDGTFQVTRVD